MELLARVFGDEDHSSIRAYLADLERKLRSGKTRRFPRVPQTIGPSSRGVRRSATPPQVRAARALGWKGRRGTVEYVWTHNGPEPASAPTAPLDYDHYMNSQVLPVARSIAAAAGFSAERDDPQMVLNL